MARSRERQVDQQANRQCRGAIQAVRAGCACSRNLPSPSINHAVTAQPLPLSSPTTTTVSLSYRFVKRAMHGTRMLSPGEVRESYGRELVNLRNEGRFVFLNTLFSVSEAVLYMQVQCLPVQCLPVQCVYSPGGGSGGGGGPNGCGLSGTVVCVCWGWAVCWKPGGHACSLVATASQQHRLWPNTALKCCRSCGRLVPLACPPPAAAAGALLPALA